MSNYSISLSSSSSSSSSDSSSSSSSEEDDEPQISNLVDVIEEVGDAIAKEDRASVTIRCMLHLYPKECISVILKLMELWGSPEYNEGVCRIWVSKASILVSNKISRDATRYAAPRLLSPLVEAGYLTYQFRQTVNDGGVFSKSFYTWVFDVVPLDAALGIAKRAYNELMEQRMTEIRQFGIIDARERSWVVVALVATPDSAVELVALQSKLRALPMDVKSHKKKKIRATVLRDPTVDSKFGKYYDMVMLCGKDEGSRTIFEARKKRVSGNRWYKNEMYFEDEGEFLEKVSDKIVIKKRKR